MPHVRAGVLIRGLQSKCEQAGQIRGRWALGLPRAAEDVPECGLQLGELPGG